MSHSIKFIEVWSQILDHFINPNLNKDTFCRYELNIFTVKISRFEIWQLTLS